jgi:uncharacterized protein
VTGLKHPLRVNVGFITHQTTGESRDFYFEFPALHLPPDLELHNFKTHAHVGRTQQGLLVQITTQADLVLECVRCLTSVKRELQTSFMELFAFSNRSVTESGLILPENGVIDFGPLIREYLILEIPISPLCKPDCKGLCPVCGEDQNLTPCHHNEEDIDPRLSSLKSLLPD